MSAITGSPSTRREAQVAAAKANVANIAAQIDSQKAQIDQARAPLDQAEAQLKFSQQEAARARDLMQTGAGTVQREQQTNSDLNAQQANTARAKSAVIAAELQDKVLATQRDSAQAQLEQAQAQLDQAKLNLGYTSIVAAQPGRVAKLSGARGAFVTPGQSLMMFVPDEFWVTANFKETQLADMRPGQPVEIRIDAYPDRELNGRVASCSRAPAPPSACCRRKTPPAITSRWCSACRSRSCSTIGPPTSPSVPACPSCHGSRCDERSKPRPPRAGRRSARRPAATIPI